MRKGRFTSAAIICIAGTLAASQIHAQHSQLRIHGPRGDSTEAVQLSPQDIRLAPSAKKGISSASLVGAAEESGVYLVRVRMEPNTSNAAHVHPDARVTTVTSGTVYYGIGSVADRDKARSFGPGSVYFTPASTPHFLMTGDEPVVYEEVGFGPSKSTPVFP